ncbi:MAG: hflX [Solirubrobacterales bacterium]|jgi:GTP-binding protein HflX|nr:hflX [Solirubrobacterales bacterium]
MQKSRNGRTDPTKNASGQKPGRAKQRAYIIAALQDGDDLSEMRELLRTAGVAVVGQTVQHRELPHPNTYLGEGKLEEVKELAKAADANVIACDDELTPRQERNLEKALGMPVVDRTVTILDIFAGHANSAEGKLQVELAQLQYNLARMRGLWTHLERLGGGIGTRGPGESQIETDRRLARDRISALKRRLEEVKGHRATMRTERGRAHLPQVALAGYTNAGKSTLLNAITGADVGVRDRLFHTLDPTTRSTKLDGRPFLFTDTVGFIRKLPHQLVQAFGATLEETKQADLVLHVVDASAEEEDLLAMLKAVDDVLEEIGAGSNPRLLVLNKADVLDEERRTDLFLAHPDGILVSAETGEGVELLQTRILEEFEKGLRDIELLIPYSEGARLAELHELTQEIEREDTPEGVLVRLQLPKTIAARYDRFSTAPPVPVDEFGDPVLPSKPAPPAAEPEPGSEAAAAAPPDAPAHAA